MCVCVFFGGFGGWVVLNVFPDKVKEKQDMYRHVVEYAFGKESRGLEKG